MKYCFFFSLSPFSHWMKKLKTRASGRIHGYCDILENGILENGIQENGIQENCIQDNGIQENGIQQNDISYNDIQQKV
jgi:hypothetical protein